MSIIFGDGTNTLTWDQARTDVRGDLWRASSASLPDAVIDNALHAALRRIEAERRWHWLEQVNATLTADLEGSEVELPVNVKSIVSIAYLSGTSGYDRLTLQQLNAIREYSRGAGLGTPTDYALSGSTVFLDCKVPAGAEFEVIFQSGCPAGVNDAIYHPPVTLSLQRSAVIAAACRHIAMTRLKNETEAARHEAAYDMLLETLFLEEDTYRGDAHGGSIMPDDALYRAAHGSC